MKKILASLIAALAAAALMAAPAAAQTAPGWTYGYVPTQAQWNAAFAGKQDYLGSSPCLVGGCVFTGPITTAASSAPLAGFNIPPGVAPTAPINGDLWTTNAGMFVRINGSTVGPLISGSTPAFSAPLVVNLNAAAAPAAQTGTGIQLVQADGVSARAELDGFGTGNTTGVPRWTCVRKDGTNASPAALVIGDEICSLNSFGYNGTAVVGPMAAVRTYAAQNWSVGANGTYLRLGVTPNGSATMADALSIENSGGITIGTLVGVDKGAGTINLPGAIYISGQPVTPATAGVAGTLLAGQGTAVQPSYSATPTLGASGTTGTLALGNATSGTVKIQTVAGALGSAVASLPANTGTIAELNLAQSWTAAQTYGTANLSFLNASGGATTLAGAASASNFTATFPANSGTVAELNLAQNFSAAQTITSASANALAVGLAGSTNPALSVDASTASSVTGFNIKSGAVAGGVALSVISSGTNENATINAKGSGTINIGGVSSGAVSIGGGGGGLTVTNSFTATGLVTNADLVNVATTVNGVVCTLGSTCTISASAGTITVGTTTVTGGPGLLFNSSSGGTLAAVTGVNNAVLVTNGTAVPSLSTTLPSGLTAPSFTVTTAFTATGLVTLGNLATQAANTVLVNATAGVASPTAQAVSSCSTASSALIWTTSTGFGCNTSITAAAVPASGLTGTTLAAGVVTSSLTTVGTIGTGTWQGAVVGGTYGGTGVNNGASTITLAGSLTHAGAFARTITATAISNATLPAGTHTLAGLDVAQSWTAIQTFANSDIKLLGSSTGATTLTSANAGASNFTLTLPAVTDTVAGFALANGGTNNALTASNGGVVYSDASKLNILAGTATANLCLLSASNSAPSWGSCAGGGGIAGPGSSVSTDLATWNGATGTALSDSGVLLADVSRLGTAQTITATKTFNNSAIKLLGSSTGATTFTSANAGASNFTLTFPAVTDTLATLGTASQVMSGGVVLTATNIGTVSSGTTTINCGSNPVQYLTDNGAFTLAAPASDSTCVLLVTNGASAGAITFSGFTVGAGTGDALTTTNTSKFMISILRINAVATYIVKALQ